MKKNQINNLFLLLLTILSICFLISVINHDSLQIQKLAILIFWCIIILILIILLWLYYKLSIKKKLK